MRSSMERGGGLSFFALTTWRLGKRLGVEEPQNLAGPCRTYAGTI